MSRADDIARDGSRRPRRGVRRTPEVTRREILEATAYLLSSRPFRDLSIGDVMKYTGVGRSTFYAHFPDVYAVVEELLSDIRDEELSYLEEWSDAADPMARFEVLIKNTVSLWARRGPMLSSMLDAAANERRIADLFEDMTDRYCAVAAAAVRQEQSTSGAAALDPHEVAALMIHGTQAYLRDRLGTPGRGDPLSVASTLRTMWMNSLYGASSPR